MEGIHDFKRSKGRRDINNPLVGIYTKAFVRGLIFVESEKTSDKLTLSRE